MKKILSLFLCLLLLTSCSNTDITVSPEPSPAPAQSTTVVTEEQSSTPTQAEDLPPANSPAQDDVVPEVKTASVIVYGLENEVLFSSELEIYEGMTAFDILLESAREKNIPVAYSGSKSSAYITSIGGLAEKQHGGMSGWIYTLNGESIMTPCGKCVLSPGDSVEFKYITEF